MVLIVLIVLWGIVLIPPAWQSHAEARRARQADAFRRKLSVLAPAPDTPLARRPFDAARPFEAARAHVAVMAPRNVVALPVPPRAHEEAEYDTGELETVAAAAAARREERGRARAEVLRRRQQVLTGLAVATPVTLMAALLFGRPWAWSLHAAVVVGFAAYLGALRRLRKLELERHAKVRHLPAVAPVAPAGRVAWAETEGARGRTAVR